jgi:hypothetical protein
MVNIAVALGLKPQARKVLNHLEKYGYITPAISFNTYANPRLAASIYELRKKGIKVRTIQKCDAMGHKYASYSLEG